MDFLHDLAITVIRLGMKIGDIVMRLLGPILVCVATGLISFIIYTDVVITLPHVFESSLPWLLFHESSLIFIAFNVLFNYFLVINTTPGYPPKVSSAEEAQGLIRRAKPTDHPEIKWCKKCEGPKPARAHHCQVCKKCVLKMDHHCPWTNNCIGWRNHRYFFLFLWWTFLGCLYSSAAAGYLLYPTTIPTTTSTSATPTPIIPSPSSLPSSSSSSLSKTNTEPMAPPTAPKLTIQQRSSVSFVFVLTSTACFALSFLMFWHMYLIATSQTTIDFQFNRWERDRAKLMGEVWNNPFDLGYRENWASFFGTSSLITWCLPSSHEILGDGVIFETRSDYLRGLSQSASTSTTTTSFNA